MDGSEVGVVLLSILIVMSIIVLYFEFLIGGFIASYFGTSGVLWWAITIITMLLINALLGGIKVYS